MLNINSFNNFKLQAFTGKMSNSVKYKKILLDDDIDTFVSSVIRKERNATGKIYNYRKISDNELEKTNEDLSNCVESFVLNDKIHLIKLDEKSDTLFDVEKKADFI